VNPEGSGIARTEVLAELRRLREDLADVDGSVVATTDGMVIAHDLGSSETYGVQPEGVAALAAVSLGLSQRITDTANHGELRDLVIRGTLGQVVTFAAGERALLTVIMSSSGDLAPLRPHAERVVRRLVELLDDNWQDDAATWTSGPGLVQDPNRRVPGAFRNPPAGL
jgi:predicted regulator of Ras-like GTPase activity (Roadblock/LC7/MglB family)